MLAQFAAQALHLLQNQSGMVNKREARRRRTHAAAPTLQQGSTSTTAGIVWGFDC